jgi:hypothetical protein
MQPRQSPQIAMHEPHPSRAPFARLRAVALAWRAVVADPRTWLEPEAELPALAIRPISTPAHVLALQNRASSSWVRAHDASQLPRWRWG